MSVIHQHYRSRIPVPREFAYQTYSNIGMFKRLTPPWQAVTTVASTGNVAPGDWRLLRLGLGPLGLHWMALHGDRKPGHFFSDEQVYGPFANWQHVHRFHADDAEHCILDDDIRYRLPLSPLSHWIALPAVRQMLQAMFRYRHLRSSIDLPRHYRYANRPRLRMLIAGRDAILTQTRAFFQSGGHAVFDSHNRQQASGSFDVVIGYAGQALDSLIMALERPPESVIRIAVPGQDHDAHYHLTESASRDITLHCGHVLTANSGVLRRALQLAKFRLRPVEASNTRFPWIALDDLIGFINQALFDEEFSNPTQMVFAAQSTLADFMATLEQTLGISFLLQAPSRLSSDISTALMTDDRFDGQQSDLSGDVAFTSLAQVVRAETGRSVTLDKYIPIL